MSEITTHPDGPFPYMNGWYWQRYQQTRQAREGWLKTWSGGDPMQSIDYVRLRLTEEIAIRQFANHRGEEIAKQHVKDAYAHRQSIGKAYGRASRTIRELRDRLQARALFQQNAIRNCTCGAWRKTRHEMFELTEGKEAP